MRPWDNALSDDLGPYAELRVQVAMKTPRQRMVTEGGIVRMVDDSGCEGDGGWSYGEGGWMASCKLGVGMIAICWIAVA